MSTSRDPVGPPLGPPRKLSEFEEPTRTGVIF